MNSARSLYRSWMRRFGSCIGMHEGEIVGDIDRLVKANSWDWARYCSESVRFWMAECDRLGQKIYDLKKGRK